MNLRQLEVLRAVLATGTVTEAGRMLGISQPAVSKLLRHTEDQLGFALFIRDRGRLLPTPEARTLFPEVNKVFTSIELVQRLAEDLQHTRSGLVTVAATPALASSLVPEAIRQFRETRPRAQVGVQSIVNDAVVEQVVNHGAEIGLVLAPVEDASTLAEDLCVSDLVCAMPPGHPLAGHDAISAQDVAAYPLISFSRHLPIGSLIEGFFRRAGLRRMVAVDVAQSFTACALARAGVGITLVDRFSLLGGGFPGLVARPLQPSQPITARLLLAPHRPLSRLALALVDEIRAVAAAGIARGDLRPADSSG